MKPLNKKLLLVLIILIGFSSLITLFVYKRIQLENQMEIVFDQKQELNKQPTISTLKTYRNQEWGFEFQYPKDWVIKENTFGSYYSKFNMLIRPTTGWYSRFPVSVNVVLSEFPERSFQGVEKITSEVVVDGVPGVKYQYEFEGSQETAIILPLGEYKLILGMDNERYLDEFNQILASFKFLK